LIIKISYIFFLAAIFAQWSKAQPEGLTVYEFPKQIPVAYQIDVSNERALMSNNSNVLLSKKEFNQFTKNIIENKIHQINEGEVYINWEVAENYLTELLAQLLPDTLKQNDINIYIRRDVLPNAYSTYDASIYINVGLLADIESEAALAFAIAHELAHYVGNHQLRNYKLLKQNKKNESNKLKKLVHKNQSLELEADKIAAQIIDRAGFDVNCVNSVFDLIYANENLFKKERVENIQQFAKPVDSTLIQSKNSTEFKTVRKLAKYEKVHLLLDQFEYNNGLHQSLNYYLLDTTLKYLPFYIVEAARRYILVHPDEMDNSIIQEDKGTPFVEYIELEKFSYKNIIEYFLQAPFLAQLPDLLFSQASYFYQLGDTIKSEQFFTKYTDSLSNKYTKLAKHLSKQTDLNSNSKKSITLINNIKSYQVKEKEDPTFNLNKSALLNQKYGLKLKSSLVREFPKQNINLQQDLITQDYKQAQLLKTTSIAILLAKNITEQYTLPLNELVFLLQPDLFNLFNEAQLSELSFINVNTFQKNKKQRFGGMVNPINWIGKFFRSYISGIENQYYTVEQIKLNQEINTVFYQLDTINFKLNLPHLLHSIYESIKSEENQGEKLVKK